jgi:hypothetical protein
MFRLLPQGQRSRHANQVMPKSARLVPILSDTSAKHQGHHWTEIGIMLQPLLVE